MYISSPSLICPVLTLAQNRWLGGTCFFFFNSTSWGAYSVGLCRWIRAGLCPLFPASPSSFSSLPSSSSPSKQWPTITRTSLVAQLAKNPPAVQETWVWSLGCEDPLEKGKATHSGILAWEFQGLYSIWGGKDSDTTEQLSLHLPLLWSSFLKFIESLLSPVLLGTFLLLLLIYVFLVSYFFH